MYIYVHIYVRIAYCRKPPPPDNHVQCHSPTRCCQSCLQSSVDNPVYSGYDRSVDGANAEWHLAQAPTAGVPPSGQSVSPSRLQNLLPSIRHSAVVVIKAKVPLHIAIVHGSGASHNGELQCQWRTSDNLDNQSRGDRQCDNKPRQCQSTNGWRTGHRNGFRQCQ